MEKTTDNVRLSDSEKLNKLLDALNLTANALSIDLNYKSPATVYHILNGVNNISEGMISRIINKYPNVNYKFFKDDGVDVLISGEELANQGNFFDIGGHQKSAIGGLEEFLKIPQKLDRLIMLQEQTNDLLLELTKQKKGTE